MNFRAILATVILSCTPLYSMESRLIRWLPGLAKSISFISSVGLPSTDALFTYNTPIDKNLPDMPEKVANYVRSYLQELGVKNIDNLILKMDEQHDWCVAGTNGLIGPKEKIEKLQEKLEASTFGSTDKLLLDTRSTLAHEASHLINRDNERRQRAVPLIALLVTIGGNRVISMMQKKFFPKTSKTIPGASLLSLIYLVSVMPKLQTTFALDNFHQRCNEIKADNFAFQKGSKEELEYTRNFYKDRHAMLKKVWNNPEKIVNFNYPWQYRLMKRIHALTSTQKSFADWIEQYPWAMRFVEYAHESKHPIDYDRMKAAELALAKFRSHPSTSSGRAVR